jgi:hypothetical protein
MRKKRKNVRRSTKVCVRSGKICKTVKKKKYKTVQKGRIRKTKKKVGRKRSRVIKKKKIKRNRKRKAVSSVDEFINN